MRINNGIVIEKEVERKGRERKKEFTAFADRQQLNNSGGGQYIEGKNFNETEQVGKL